MNFVLNPMNLGKVYLNGLRINNILVPAILRTNHAEQTEYS